MDSGPLATAPLGRHRDDAEDAAAAAAAATSGAVLVVWVFAPARAALCAAAAATVAATFLSTSTQADHLRRKRVETVKKADLFWTRRKVA